MAPDVRQLTNFKKEKVILEYRKNCSFKTHVFVDSEVHISLMLSLFLLLNFLLMVRLQ